LGKNIDITRKVQEGNVSIKKEDFERLTKEIIGKISICESMK